MLQFFSKLASTQKKTKESTFFFEALFRYAPKNNIFFVLSLSPLQKYQELVHINNNSEKSEIATM